MIDSHCHLTDPRLFQQLDQVIQRAKAVGIDRFVTIGTTPADDQAAIELCHKHSNVRCAVGIHPNHSHEVEETELPRLRELQADPCVVALGEMGLDYFHKFADRARQRRFFEAQLQMAIELNRPIVIHSRGSIDNCLEVMRGFPKERAVFHCFTGSRDEGHRIIEAGYLLGFTGVVTFKRSDELRTLASEIPADRILIETDAPYLSPEPVRSQKINESSLMIHTARAVATARGITLQALDQLTTDNTSRFYGMP